MQLVSDIINGKSRGQFALGLFLDLSKAFDTLYQGTFL